MYRVIGSDGQVYGPADALTIQNWIQTGRVLPNTIVIDPIDDSSKPAYQIPEFAQYFSQGYPPPTTPVQLSSPYNSNLRPGFNQQIGSYGALPKSKATAAALAFFLGGFGAHRYYLGHTNTAAIMTVLCFLGCALHGIPFVILLIWASVDFVQILSGNLVEANGRPLI